MVGTVEEYESDVVGKTQQEKSGESRHAGLVYLPVENHGFDLVVEAIQSDVVCHELFHLQLVCDIHGSFIAAAFGYCKPDKATAGANLESGGDMSVSCHVVVVFVASCWMKSRHKRHLHPSLLQLIAMVAQHMLGESHPGRPKHPSASRLYILVKFQRLGQETTKVESRVGRSLVLRQRSEILVECQRVELR